jgi:hypothetical protein
MRARGLEEGLREYIVGDKAMVDNKDFQELLFNNPLITSMIPEDGFVTKLVDKFSTRNLEKRPISISPQTFATVLFDTLIPDNSGHTTVDKLREKIDALPTNMPLREPILHIIATTSGDITNVRTNVENWYDAAMVKTTKLYQAHLWRIALGITLAIAVLLNVDTISILRTLWSDSTLRTALSTEANTFAKNSDQEQNALNKLNALGLPIGWTGSRAGQCLAPNDWFPRPEPGLTSQLVANDPCKYPAMNWYDYVFKLLGWIITAFAGAQGAPFWFDILRKATSRD